MSFAVFYDFRQVKRFSVGGQKRILISLEHKPLDSPMVIDEIRVEKIHAPAFSLWWETAKEQDFCIFKDKWSEGMVFNLPRGLLYMFQI